LIENCQNCVYASWKILDRIVVASKIGEIIGDIIGEILSV